MHHVNYFWVDLGTANMGQCISLTDYNLLGWLCRIYNIITNFVHITIRVLLGIPKT